MTKLNKILFLIAMAFTVASCGSRKYTPNNAARAAEAMSKLGNKQLYRFVTEWAGVRYKFGGLDKRGIDCSGFAYLLEKDIYGYVLPRRSKDQAEVVREKSLSNLKEGDLIFFSFEGGDVDHVGVYLNGVFFVHASTNRGVVVDDISLPTYQKAIVKTGTLK